MLKKTHLLIAFLLFNLGTLWSQQEYVFTATARSSYNGNKISNDDRGNIMIAAKSKLTKLDMDGNFLAHYYPMFQGDITCIDAKDPRRILLYYKEYAYVMFLNQELGMAGSLSIYTLNSRPEPVELDDLNLTYTSLACLDEYNESYWVYDENTTDIILLDQNNQIDFKADALDQIMDEEPNPNFMIMEENRLFINNPATGVYIFDENGNFVRILPLMGLQKIQVHKDLLFYTTSSTLIVLDLKTGKESYNPLPVLGFKDWSLASDIIPMRISFLTGEGLLIYSLDKI